MEGYTKSRSYGTDMMQIETYYPPPPPPPKQPGSYDIRCYSASYAQTQMGIPNRGFRDSKLKKGKTTSGSSSSSSWSLSDPEFQRKRRVASYKMYSVEGKMKGSLRRSFRWLKDSHFGNVSTRQIVLIALFLLVRVLIIAMVYEM